ncbi:MAG: hypothetical protein CM15mV74_040 [uncultured marine virus]|nr:MAG: hypothetical protein CM15mV74_040 [uncultured marine virus]
MIDTKHDSPISIWNAVGVRDVPEFSDILIHCVSLTKTRRAVSSWVTQRNKSNKEERLHRQHPPAYFRLYPLIADQLRNGNLRDDCNIDSVKTHSLL